MAKLMICIAGMPGSGKSVIARVASDLGIPVYNMGDIVREETMKRYGRITPELMVETSRAIREEYGEDVVAIKTIEKIRGVGEVVVIDGVRSLKEIEVFRRHADRVVVVAVHASPKTRYKRLRERMRPGDPSTWEEFRKRDFIELSFGVGDVIALADYMIVNEGSLEEAYESAKKLFKELVGV